MGTHWKGLKYFDWSRKDCEIWMFNEAPHVLINGKTIYPTPDILFQLHHEAIWKNPKNRNDEKYYSWLKSGNTPPIYMQNKYPDVPKSKNYPLKEVLALIKNVSMVIEGKEKTFKYFSSSPEYALALAAYLNKKGYGYKRIEVWGIELERESEYFYQRTGFAFWCGYLAALGVNLVLANSIFDAPMYGYEGDMPISSEFFKNRIIELTKELGDKKDRYNTEAKTFLDRLLGLLNADISKTVETEMNEIIKRNDQAGILNGQIKECKRYLEKAQAMEGASGSSIFSIGEFDQMSVYYHQKYTDARTDANNVNIKMGFLLKRLLLLKKGSLKRKRALDEFGTMIAEMMNKNMLLLHCIGGIEENKYFINLAKSRFNKTK